MRNPRRGQSVVEFIFVILAFLNILVVTINATMAFAVQQYVSYATFMAARAYQASNLSPQDQADAATRVLSSYLFVNGVNDANEKIFRFEADGSGTAHEVTWELPDSSDSGLAKYGQMPPGPGRRIQVKFKVPLFKLPFGDLSQGFAWIELSAVSYLGREPTVTECRKFFESFYNYYRQGGGAADGWVAMDDNNC